MIYALAVHGAPHSSDAAEHALSFIEALQASGHEVERVFFFHEGVYQGLNGQVTPQSLHDNALQPRWAAVAAQGIELAVCIASGIKRGVTRLFGSLPSFREEITGRVNRRLMIDRE